MYAQRSQHPGITRADRDGRLLTFQATRMCRFGVKPHPPTLVLADQTWPWIASHPAAQPLPDVSLSYSGHYLLLLRRKRARDDTMDTPPVDLVLQGGGKRDIYLCM